MIRVLIPLLPEQTLHQVNNAELRSLFPPQNLQLQALQGAAAAARGLPGIWNQGALCSVIDLKHMNHWTAHLFL